VYFPNTPEHTELKRLRDKVYAHTDEASGRKVSLKLATREGDVVTVEWREEWLPFPREDLAGYIAHFERLRDRYRTEAASIHVQLHGLGPDTG
jgi:hypothetical protein